MMFITLEKVDVKQRLVYGTIACEEPDRSGEILDYASAKAAFMKWSEEQNKASGGKSYGNVRSMHNRTAAGKVAQPLHFDDQLKKISACVYVSDDNDWQKVQDGTFTGFSPGGGYAKIWPDEKNKALKRYTPVIIELSLVDVPCQPSATFNMVKADGTEELKKFRNAEEIGDLDQGFRAKDGTFFKAKVLAEKYNKYLADQDDLRKKYEAETMHPGLAALNKADQTVSAMEAERDDDNNDDEDDEDEETQQQSDLANHRSAADRKKKLGKDAGEITDAERKKAAAAGEAEPDGSYPVRNEGELKDAIHAFGRSKNKPKTKAHIKRRANQLGLAHLIPDKWKCVDLQKGFDNVARLAEIICQLDWLQQSCDMEQKLEGDADSSQPEALHDACQTLIGIIKEMVIEEGAEMEDCPGDKIVKLPAGQTLNKLLTETLSKIKFEQAAVEPPADNELKKALEKVTSDFATVTTELAAERKVTGDLTNGLEKLTKRLEFLERQPVSPRGPLRAVSREHERTPAPELRKEVNHEGTGDPVVPPGLSPKDQRIWLDHQQRKNQLNNRR